MAHLLAPRKGWENERLASYLLSRFSFVAQPTSIADDVGSDFFCTIFNIENVADRDVLIPRRSFSIQVKSSTADLEMDNKVDYLLGLELPFFVGVVSQAPAEMKIYSAEMLPVMLSEFGRPEGLRLAPVQSYVDRGGYFETLGEKQFRLWCPLAVTVAVDDDRSTLAAKVETLLGICGRAQSNIATRVNEEHIYDVDGKGQYRIMAGSGSVRFFRSNFAKPLGEYFYNLLWILQAQPDRFVVDEFRLFESLYQQLESLYGTSLPEYVSIPYLALKGKIAGLRQ
jgi:hypothetical protein